MTSNQTMKFLVYLSLFLFFTNCKENKPEFVKTDIIPTKIDSLNTIEQVENYVRGFRYPIIESFESQKADLTHNFLEKFELKKIAEFNREFDSITKLVADSLNISESFYKTDIDNNGFTDLIVIGDDKSCEGDGKDFDKSCDFSVFCFMNFGNNIIEPIDLLLENSIDKSIVPKVSQKIGVPILEIHEPAEFTWEKEKIAEHEIISLAYVFGSLIEYNENPKDYNIEKIEFQTEISGYKHPHFEIIIKNNQTAWLKAKGGNSIYENTKVYYKDTIPEIKGEFESRIKKNDYDELIDILNYMDFPNIENNYSMNRFHARECSLKITYNKGEIKEITDYGMVGTYGLKRVYKLLFNLRFNQEWK